MLVLSVFDVLAKVSYGAISVIKALWESNVRPSTMLTESYNLLDGAGWDTVSWGPDPEGSEGSWDD